MKPAQAAHLSIVVLPFANLSGGLSQDYFADGVTDDLTGELSLIRDTSQSPIHQEARGLHDMDLDPASGKETREPKSVAPNLMGQDHPSDLPARRCALGL
jgi:hypothetical protein